MQAHNYPGFAEHLQKHEELKATLAELVQDFEEEGANTDPLPMQLIRFSATG